MFITSKVQGLYRSVSTATDMAAYASREQTGMRNKIRAASTVGAGVAAMLMSNLVNAQAATTDTMASVATEGQRLANLAITSLSVIVLLAAVIVIIGKVFSVLSGRSSWGDVMAALVISAFIAVIAGVILGAATTAATSIAA